MEACLLLEYYNNLHYVLRLRIGVVQEDYALYFQPIVLIDFYNGAIFTVTFVKQTQNIM